MSTVSHGLNPAHTTDVDFSQILDGLCQQDLTSDFISETRKDELQRC